MKTPKTYIKTFFTNCILKNSSIKTAFILILRTSEKNTKNNWRQKRSFWTLIIFSSKVINFKHLAQACTITKLFALARSSLRNCLNCIKKIILFSCFCLSSIYSVNPLALVLLFYSLFRRVQLRGLSALPSLISKSAPL